MNNNIAHHVVTVVVVVCLSCNIHISLDFLGLYRLRYDNNNNNSKEKKKRIFLTNLEQNTQFVCHDLLQIFKALSTSDHHVCST